MALEKGSVAELAIDRDLSFGDVIECPTAGGYLQRFRVTAIGECYVLGRRCGVRPPGGGWVERYEEDEEILLSRSHVEGAVRVG